jgi:hypothetical protein
MDVIASYLEILAIANAVVCKSALPDRQLGGDPVRKAAFDESHGTLDRAALRREQEMYVIRHDDEGVQFVMTFTTVLLQGLKK